MTLTTYPMQDNFETKLSQAWNGWTGTVYVQAAPSFTMPAWTFCVVTVDPGTDKEQAFIMDSFSVANKTLNCQSIAVDKWPWLAYTQKTHSVGAKVIISDNYRHWKKIVDEFTVTATTDGTNVFTGAIGFSGTSNVWLTVKSLTTAQRDALSPSNWAIIYNTTAGEFQVYQSSAWATLASGSTQPNASTTVAGKVEAPTQTEVEQLATTWGTGALVFVTPTTINPSSITSATPASWDKISFSDVNDNNYLKSTTVSTLLNMINTGWFWDASDWDVTISWTGTTTLTRDMYYNNLTINSWATLDPAWYRIFVRNTFSGTGTINRNGNNWGDANNNVWGAAGATLSQGSLNAEVATSAWANGVNYWITNGNSATWTNANPSMHTANWANWWTGWAPSGTTGWTWIGGTSTRWTLYNKAFSPYLIHPATSQTTFPWQNYKWTASASGWWSGAAATTSSTWTTWWWWGGWTNWWFIWIACYNWNFTGIITSTWGNWWNWWYSTAYGGNWWWGWGGGWGGNGWIVLRIYNTLQNDASFTLTWWTGGAWGTALAWPSWAAWSNGSAWTTISIQV